ncbi:MAG: alpha/beta hydrolase family protein [Candidatus Hodarchaeota archaeon]
MNYNPFSRGPFPVGVLSQDLYHSLRKRTLPTEIWYPATDEYRGQDLSEETKDKFSIVDIPLTQEAVRDAKLHDGTFPLILYSHGYGAYRRLAPHLCTHLASHGYVVVSPDHFGTTIMDLISFADKTEQEIMKIIGQGFLNRPRDIRFLINCILRDETSIPSNVIDEERIGVIGYSIGGWTILMATSKDERISAALPIALPGGASQDPNEQDPMYETLKALDLNWKREVPTLYLAAEKDNQVPIATIYDLFNRTHEPKSMVVLNNADHLQFCANMEPTHEWMRSQPEMVLGDTPATKRIKENMLPFRSYALQNKQMISYVDLGSLIWMLISSKIRLRLNGLRVILKLLWLIEGWM